MTKIDVGGGRDSAAALILTNRRVIHRRTRGWWGRGEKALWLSSVTTGGFTWRRSNKPLYVGGILLVAAGLTTQTQTEVSIVLLVLAFLSFLLFWFNKRIVLSIGAANGRITVVPSDEDAAAAFLKEQWSLRGEIDAPQSLEQS